MKPKLASRIHVVASNTYSTLLIALLVLSLQSNVLGKSSSPSIPRSTNSRSIYIDTSDDDDSSLVPSSNSQRKSLPPWNTSPKIDKYGFLATKYQRTHGSWEFVNEEGLPRDVDREENTNTNSNIKSNINNALLHVIGGRFQNLDEPVYIRQVPGDGNCLFHSISVSLSLLNNRTHVDMNVLPKRSKNGNAKTKRDEIVASYTHDLRHLHHYSRYLRLAAVSILSRNPRKLLFLQGNEYLRAKDLVSAAAAQYGMTSEEYCEQMKEDSYWGGGPEICALCNFLKRPIHVYELCNDWNSENEKEGTDDIDINVNEEEENDILSKAKCNSHFRLRRMACFGSPKFDRREALHILSADSRFPDITPGKQLPSGNHFLALFPETIVDNMARKRTRAEIRGGNVDDHDFKIQGKGRRRKISKHDHLIYFEDQDSMWNRGILKYTRVDFIWRFVQRLKLAFL